MMLQTGHGGVLLRDAGVITFADSFDLATNEFLGTEVTITGPHPEADSDFVLSVRWSRRRWPSHWIRRMRSLAPPAGFEPATFRLEGGCSVH